MKKYIKKYRIKLVQKIKGVIFVWSEEIRNNLSKELEIQLDNKKFFCVNDYHDNATDDIKTKN